MTRAHSHQSSSTAFSKTQQHLSDLADPFGSTSLRRSMTAPSRNNSITALPDFGWRSSSNYQQSYSLPPSREPSPTPTVKSRPATSGHDFHDRSGLPRLLAALTSAINEFTFHSSFSSASAISSLNLSSPAVRVVRCPHVADRHYVATLSKIFPSTFAHGEDLLGALAAWIILDIHLCKAISAMRSRHQDQLQQYGLSASISFPDMNSRQQRVEEDNHQRRPALQRETSHQYSYSTLVNQSNSSLQRIPTKARNLFWHQVLSSI